MQQVEWAEFELQDLFEKIKTNNVIQNGIGDLPATTAILSNNQIGRYIARDNATVLEKVFSATANGTGKVFYQPNKFTVLQDSYAFKFKNADINISKIHNFIVAILNKVYERYDWNNKSGWEKVKTQKIALPVKSDENLEKLARIDFDFIEQFIGKLEAVRLSQLDNYLAITGLKDYALTDNERQVVADFQAGRVTWSEYKMADLFDKIKTKKLPYQAKSLPTEPTGEYTLPCLTSSFKNQGLNYFAPIDGATILKNVISIPSNSDVYRAYFQSRDFTVLSDAYAIKWRYDDKKYDAKLFLFMVACINQVTDLPIYSYKNKLGGWNVVKDKYIQLPTKNNLPDISTMQTLISALQKLMIKDVVNYSFDKMAKIE